MLGFFHRCSLGYKLHLTIKWAGYLHFIPEELGSQFGTGAEFRMNQYQIDRQAGKMLSSHYSPTKS